LACSFGRMRNHGTAMVPSSLNWFRLGKTRDCRLADNARLT
jgi:hypothetical protein